MNHPFSRIQWLKFWLWLVFLNGLIIACYSFYAISEDFTYAVDLKSLYLMLQNIGHFQFFVFILACPLLLLVILFPFKRFIKILALIFFSSILLLAIIDYSVYKLYKFHINGMVWNLLTGGAASEIFVFDSSNFIIATVIIGLILLLEYGLISISLTLSQSKKSYGILAFMSVLAIQISGQTLHAFASAQRNTKILDSERFIPLAQPVLMDDFLYDNNLVERKASKRVMATSSGTFHYPLKKMQCQALNKKPNIVFILLDSVRFDMLNKEVMPNWSAFASQNLQFNHHISTGNATRYGIFGLFSGIYSQYWFDALNNQTHSVLITELLKNGYDFGFFGNARLSSPEFDRAVFSQVKQHIPDKTQGDTVISRDYKITELAKDFFNKQQSKPFFSFIFYDAPHAYAYPESFSKFKPDNVSINYLTINNDTDPEPIRNRYKNAIHFNDTLSQQLLDTLKQNEQFDDSIIILTADHGQEMNETHSNSWGHNNNFSKYQTQVPLLIHWPGKTHKVFNQLSSHADVIPTLMQKLFHCSNPIADYSNGQSLLDESERDFVLVGNWTNKALVTKDFVREFHQIRVPLTYDADTYQAIDTNNKPEYSRFDLKMLEANSHFYKK